MYLSHLEPSHSFTSTGKISSCSKLQNGSYNTMQPVGEICLTFFLNNAGQDPSFSLDFYKYLWACIYEQATHLFSYNSSTYTLEHRRLDYLLYFILWHWALLPSALPPGICFSTLCCFTPKNNLLESNQINLGHLLVFLRFMVLYSYTKNSEMLWWYKAVLSFETVNAHNSTVLRKSKKHFKQ